MDIQPAKSSKDGFQANDEWSAVRVMNLPYSNEEQYPDLSDLAVGSSRVYRFNTETEWENRASPKP